MRRTTFERNVFVIHYQRELARLFDHFDVLVTPGRSRTRA
jgi:hypothetical protein